MLVKSLKVTGQVAQLSGFQSVRSSEMHKRWT
jgi:hypothetical protein